MKPFLKISGLFLMLCATAQLFGAEKNTYLTRKHKKLIVQHAITSKQLSMIDLVYDCKVTDVRLVKTENERCWFKIPVKFIIEWSLGSISHKIKLFITADSTYELTLSNNQKVVVSYKNEHREIGFALVAPNRLHEIEIYELKDRKRGLGTVFLKYVLNTMHYWWSNNWWDNALDTHAITWSVARIGKRVPGQSQEEADEALVAWYTKHGAKVIGTEDDIFFGIQISLPLMEYTGPFETPNPLPRYCKKLYVPMPVQAGIRARL